MIYQDDTHVRILSLLAENRQAATKGDGHSQPSGRTGMYTTGLVVQHGERTIGLYVAGRAHVGEHLGALVARRGARQTAGDVRCPRQQCSGCRGAHPVSLSRTRPAQVRGAWEVSPSECAEVIKALKQVFGHDEEAREQQMSAAERFK